MIRIYLVDDHVMVRDGLRAMVKAAGHEVVGESADLTKALDDLTRLSPDVVLLDLNLGTRSGLELLVELQRRKCTVRTIVTTMSAQPHHVTEALRFGASGYVLKGASGHELLEAIDSVMTGHRYLSHEASEIAVRALSADAQGTQLSHLSPRERQIISMVVNGQSSTAIGHSLHLSPKTVDTYRSRLMKKLEVHDVPGLVRWAIRNGLLDADMP